MKTSGYWRQLRSLVLPFAVVIVVPLLLLAAPGPLRLGVRIPYPWVQLPGGLFFFLAGFFLLVSTIRLFVRFGQGTLAPWDPTRRLVIRGAYAHVRNPMISGVLLMLAGETVLFGSWSLLIWWLFVLAANTAYFKLSEEPGLARRFGRAYERYRQNVPMWIPRLKPWKEEEP